MFKPIQVMLCAFMVLFIFSCSPSPVTLENGETLRPGIRADEKDKIILTRYLDHCKTEVGKIDEAKIKEKTAKNPEMLCWVELKQLRTALISFELTGNTDYLRLFKTGFEKIYASLTTTRDGYLGWVGLPIKSSIDPENPDTTVDEIQTGFQAISVLGHFCTLVKSDPKLVKEYDAECKKYLDLAENHLFKKWDTRGNWTDLGSRGGTYRWNFAYIAKRKGLSLAFEKLSIMVSGLLNLHHATGNDLYMRRAVRITTWFKHCLKLKDGSYSWKYWEPVGEWDKDPAGADKWKHWLGPEPNAGWHNATVSMVMSLYRHGLVFDKTDRDRFLKTQLGVCWNGNPVKPLFRYNNGKETKKPMVCYALAPYSKKLESFLFSGPRLDEQVAVSESSWKGLVAASDWVRTRFLLLPREQTGTNREAEYGRVFMAKKDNGAFMKVLKKTISEPGYITPETPSQADFLQK